MFPLLCLSAVLAIVLVQASDPLSTDNPAVQNEIINLINDCRRNVDPSASNMVKATWSSEAQQNAQRVAQKCNFVHSDPSERKTSKFQCGENLYMTTGEGSWAEAINAFDNEKKDFIFGKGPVDSSKIVGHYTQLVWYNSRETGCAVADCPNGPFKKFFVCHQCPPGNVNSSPYPYNKGDKCKECPNNCDNGLCTNPCPWANTISTCNQLKPYCTLMDQVKNGCQASCNCNNNEII
ncbi:cysteine-rich venom protein-like [Pseudophryne corroboree]|uniref:cysteine-rich venom protein-like n=1 Tax=Pseudophryne corroboree TaxID=495146 RepID=UPI003081A353